MHSQLPTRVSAAESDGEGRRRVMRWKKAVFVIWFIWGRNERESEVRRLSTVAL